jgi:hypothetical protein
MSPSPWVIEVIGTHTCVGCRAELPEVVRSLAEECGVAVTFRAYCAWDVGEESESLPPHVREHLARMRAGELANAGFFLNGTWLPLSPHRAEDVVAARQALEAAFCPRTWLGATPPSSCPRA